MWQRIKNFFKKPVKIFAAESYGEHGLTRKYRGYFSGFLQGDHYDYFCECGTTLTEGPSGGMSVNAVCEKCKINYGCLPGYFGDQS